MTELHVRKIREIERVPVKNRPITVGRSSLNDVSLPHNSVSRRHCVIEPAPDGTLYVRDLDSHYGIKVNGDAVPEANVRPGDEITIGPYTIVVVGEQLDIAAAPAPDTALQEEFDARAVVLERRGSELNARAAALDAREATLDERQQKLDNAPPPPPVLPAVAAGADPDADEMLAELTALEERLNTREAELQQRLDQLDQRERDLGTRDDDLRTRGEKTATEAADAAAILDQLDQRTRELDEREAALDLREEDQSDLSDQSTAYAAQFKDVSAREATLREQEAALARAQAEFESVLQQLDADQNALETQTSEDRAALERRAAEIEAAEADAIQKAREEAIAQQKQALEELDEQRTTLESLRSDMGSLQQTIETQNAELDALRAKITTQEEALDDERAALASATEAWTVTRGELERQQAELAAKLAASDAELATLNQARAELEQTRDENTAEIETLGKQIQEHLDAAATERRSFEERVGEVESENESLRQLAHRHVNELESRAKQLDAAASGAETLISRIRSLESDHQEALGDRDVIEQRLVSVRTVINQLRQASLVLEKQDQRIHVAETACAEANATMDEHATAGTLTNTQIEQFEALADELESRQDERDVVVGYVRKLIEALARCAGM